jgi:shikimate kinase
MNRIFLIGYMGSGKTTVGKSLAEKLGYSFVDMDLYIEEKHFKAVYQIFEELGEEKFRLIEKQTLHEVAQFENVVISTGGGAPCYFDNMDYMNAQGTTVYLKLSIKQLAVRLETSKANKRPLLANRKGEELRQFIFNGLSKRESFYNHAKITVNGSDEQIIKQICSQIATQ